MLFCSLGVSSRAYGVTVRNRGLRGTRMGRPFLFGGLRARVSSWPPLRLVRLRCERVSVGVVPSQRFPSLIKQKGVVGVVRYIGMDVHREFAQLAVVEDGLVRDEGRIAVTPEALRRWAVDLRSDDEVALEATGNSDAIANLLTPIVGRVVVSNPSKTRAIAEAKVKTDLLTELSAGSVERCVRCPGELARFPACDRRGGRAAGVVHTGGAAARLAGDDRGSVSAVSAG